MRPSSTISGTPPPLVATDRFSSRHAFNDDLAEGLSLGGGMHHQVQLRDGALDVAAEAGKFHDVFDSELTRQAPDLLLVLIFAEQGRSDDKKTGIRKTPVHQRRCLDENVLAFPGRNSSHQADPALRTQSVSAWWARL